MADDSQISALERLAKLRNSGSLTEDEYQRQKAKILSGGAKVPFYRRLWFVVSLTCLVITFPISLLILVTGDVYKNNKTDGLQPISTRARYIYAAALVLWILALIVKAAIDPQSAEQVRNANAVDQTRRESVPAGFVSSLPASQTNDASSAGTEADKNSDLPQGVHQSTFLGGITIDASSYNECVSKGAALIPSGTSVEDIENYCTRRYVLHADCTEEQLTGSELNVLKVEFRTHSDNLFPDRKETDLFITNLSRTKWLMKVTYIWQDGTYQKPVERQPGPVGGLAPGQTYQSESNQYMLPSGDFGYFKSVKLLSAIMCQP